MELLRNREIRRQLIICAVISLAAALTGLLVSGPLAAALLLFLGAVLIAVDLLYLRKRYGDMKALTESIDRILHGQEEFLISGSDEGELAILTSEIQKMTVKLRDQADMLSSEKIRLTDAIADMFHQMRTPLTSMKLQLSLLDAEDLSYERRLELARALKKQMERLHWLTETLLKMSKIDAGTAGFRKDRVSVKTLINKAAGPFLIPMELRDQRLVTQAGTESFEGDLAWTTEALGNLIKNCMEHTPAGGSVTVSALETALYTQITVTDTGSGFDPADIPHIFERFYRGSNATDESIGIGLALSRAIIAGQGGTIAAENAPGGGACFTIRFYKSIV